MPTRKLFALGTKLVLFLARAARGRIRDVKTNQKDLEVLRERALDLEARARRLEAIADFAEADRAWERARRVWRTIAEHYQQELPLLLVDEGIKNLTVLRAVDYDKNSPNPSA